MKNRFKTLYSEINKRPDILKFLDGDESISKLFDLPNTLATHRIILYKSIYEGVGHTPVYQLPLPNNNRLHIKSEYFNSMGNSHYSRCWIPYLFVAEVLNIIIPGETHLIEVTSGNAGIALAMACEALNYKLTLVIPSFLPDGRVYPMINHGADIVKVDGYIDKCIHRLKRLVVSNQYFPCNHSEEMADILVKIDKRISAEYIRDFGKPDFAIVGLGNGTSTVAIFDYFKKISNNIKTITFHPDPEKDDLVFGLFRPIFNLRHIEPALNLSDVRLYTTGRDLSEVKHFFEFDTEIVNFGFSSLYAIHIAMEYANIESNQTFFTIAYDKIDRYL